MSHSSRPVPAKRIFASLEPHYPVRESDGEPHLSPMLDLRQLRIQEARDGAYRWFGFARAARLRGDFSTWHFCVLQGSAHRRALAGLKRSGGQVDWRGEPVQEVSRG